jgi:nucleoside-diphosphate-sugar epimerase
MNILITGMSGFIGSHIAQGLLEKGHVLFALIRKGSQEKVSFLAGDSNLNILPGDFHDPDVLNTVSDKIDCILHFASIRGAGMGTLNDYTKINVGGTQALLDFAKNQNVGKFIYCSTVGVLGSIPKKVPAAPDDKPRADGLYHQTKYESEKRVLAENSANLKTCVLRPTITYGPRDDGFIPKMISMVAGKKLILPSGTVKLHLLGVNAFATLVSSMIESEVWAGKIYHVADKDPVVLRELVNKISNIVSHEDYPGIYKVPGIIYRLSTILLTVLGMQKFNTSIKLISRNWYYDIQKTVDELNYQAVDTLTSIESVIDGN